jgi:uncharacterized membrane protein YedE/YeeE
MKYVKFLLLGIGFGFIMVKSEAVSWFRIQEMFRFQAFHMFGIIGSAVVIGAIAILIIKKLGLRDIYGNKIIIPNKDKGWKRYLIGGSIFGLGWGLTGACPGPMFVLLGQGFGILVVTIVSAFLGTFVYGLVKDKLPH